MSLDLLFLKLQLLFQTAFAEGSFATIPIVFFAGVLSCFTPCVYPMIPVMFVAFHRYGDGNIKKTIGFALLYVLSFSFLYTIMGVFSAYSGAIFGRWAASPWLNLILALLIFALALSMFGLFDINLPKLQFKRVKLGTLILFGGISSIVFSACAVPVLAMLLILIAQSKNIFFGAILMFSYSLGIGVVFIAIGFLGTRIKLKNPRLLFFAKILLGVIVLIPGIYFFSKFIQFL